MKPINLLYTKISAIEKVAVIDGIKKVYSIAGKTPVINDIGLWKDAESGKNLAHLVGTSMDKELMGIDSNRMIMSLDSLFDGDYNILITQLPMFKGSKNVIEETSSNKNISIISTIPLKNFRFKSNLYEGIKTVAMHEIIRLFGIPDEDRTDIMASKMGGYYCSSDGCLMLEPKDIHNIADMTNIRLKRDKVTNCVLCSYCYNDLLDYFK